MSELSAARDPVLFDIGDIFSVITGYGLSDPECPPIFQEAEMMETAQLGTVVRVIEFVSGQSLLRLEEPGSDQGACKVIKAERLLPNVRGVLIEIYGSLEGLEIPGFVARLQKYEPHTRKGIVSSWLANLRDDLGFGDEDLSPARRIYHERFGSKAPDDLQAR